MTLKRLPVFRPTHWIYLLGHATAALLGLVLVLVGSRLGGVTGAGLFAVGTSLTAAGLSGWMIFTYIVVSERTAERLELLQRFGLVNAFEGRAVLIKKEYDTRLRVAKDRVDVLGFGLRSLREDYRDQFERWKHQAAVRVLLIDPDFPSGELSYAAQRDSEETDERGSIAEQVHRFVRDASGALDDRFQIRLYRCLPSVNIFRVDDDLFWGPYFVRELSRNAPTFLVRSGGVLFDKFVSHFERIWDDDALSRAIPPQWLEQ
jgi:hypothetical protein